MKHKGNATLISGILLTLLVSLWYLVTNILTLQNVLAQDIQDSVYFANTSVYKYIDKKLLGEDQGYLTIEDPNKALQVFKDKLKYNMVLDSNFKPKKESKIEGKVNIKNFIIYNVQGNQVDIYTLSSYGLFTKTSKDLSKEKILTPNKYNVTCTTVHTTISFGVKGLQGDVTEQEVAVDTDILNYKG